MISITSYISINDDLVVQESKAEYFRSIDEPGYLKTIVESSLEHSDIIGYVSLKINGQETLGHTHSLYIISFWISLVYNLIDYVNNQECKIHFLGQVICIYLKKEHNGLLIYTFEDRKHIRTAYTVSEKEFLTAFIDEAKNVFNYIVEYNPKDDDLIYTASDHLIRISWLIRKLGLYVFVVRLFSATKSNYDNNSQ